MLELEKVKQIMTKEFGIIGKSNDIRVTWVIKPRISEFDYWTDNNSCGLWINDTASYFLQINEYEIYLRLL